MAKNLTILLLGIMLVASWIWPRFGGWPSASEGPPEPGPFAALDETIRAMQGAPGFEGASLGLCVLLDREDPVYTYGAHESMTPASTLKVVTSATATELLGPDFRFETRLEATRGFELEANGRFEGDLILIGGGDPVFTNITLGQWADELRDRGLKQIDGRIIADGRCFPEQLIPDAWEWGDVGNYYGAGSCGLNLDLNRFTVTFGPAEKTGQPAVIVSVTPPLDWVEQHNLTTTVAEGESEWTSIYGGPYAERLTFRGTIPRDRVTVSSKGAIPDPAYHVAWRFTEMLRTEGITVGGEPTTMRRLSRAGEAVPSATARIMEHKSDSLRKIISYLHGTSDNLVAECLFQKLIEMDASGRSGGEIVATHWEGRGVSFGGLRMEDGSGLARADCIRPVDLARVLWVVRRGPHGETYSQTLKPYDDGRVRWKSGTMSGVRAYVGYTENGYTFALMINNYESGAGILAGWRRRIIQKILELP